MRVFVLLFNARTENEGIHSISMGDRNVVLMFAEEDDATRYALLLEAQDFPEPAVEAIDQDEVEEFCKGSGYEWKPEGESAIEEVEPPDPEIERMRRKLEGLL